MCTKTFASSVLVVALLTVVFSTHSDAKKLKKDRVLKDFHHADVDGDNKLSRKEWNRRGNFERLDANKDEYLSLDEVRALYDGHSDKYYKWPPKGMAKPVVDIDPSVATDRIGPGSLDNETICGIARTRACGIESQKRRGLFETGTGPRFPDRVRCPSIDDYWAMDYTNKRNRESFHGGIDLPVPWGTPMRAVAAGSVVAKYEAHMSKRGIELVLRHSPDQTGLPMWTYSAYGHLDAMPDLEIGQRVRLGQIIGPTGNSGISARGSKGGKQSTTRRPAIHFAMFYGDSGSYSEVKNTVVPLNGYWLDPMAFYRQKEPYDTASVKAQPEAEKDIAIPVMLDDGTTLPADTRIVWPYACQRE